MKQKGVALVISRARNPNLYKVLRRTPDSVLRDAFAAFAVDRPSKRSVSSSDAMKVLLKSIPLQLRRHFRAQILAARKG